MHVCVLVSNCLATKSFDRQIRAYKKGGGVRRVGQGIRTGNCLQVCYMTLYMCVGVCVPMCVCVCVCVCVHVCMS